MFCEVCFCGNYDKVEYLVKQGVNIDERDLNGKTPLFYACKNENIVKYLISQGVDINKENKNGDTPLMLACFYGNYDIVKDLVDRGYSIAVYPEGTRSKDCKIGRFHQGAFFIAERLNLDILPMCLYGTGKILPKKTYSLNKGPIYIEVEEPIKVEGLKRIGELKDQASYMRKLYIAKYSCISNCIERNA